MNSEVSGRQARSFLSRLQRNPRQGTAARVVKLREPVYPKHAKSQVNSPLRGSLARADVVLHRAPMNLMQAIFWTVVISSPPAVAQTISPEGEAYYAASKCVERAAIRYASLNGTVGDIADAALSSCKEETDAFSTALRKSTSPSMSRVSFDDMMREIRGKALALIANARAGENQ